VLFLVSFASAATVVFQPDNTGTINGDAFVTTGIGTAFVNNNYGGAGALAVSAALSKGAFDSVLRFDLNPGPNSITSTFDNQFGAGQWIVDAVILTMSVTSPNNSIFNGYTGSSSTAFNTPGQIGVRWLPNDSWTEGNGTPSAANSIPGAITYSSLTGTGGYDSVFESLGTFSFNPGTTNNASGTFTASFAPSSGLLSDILNLTSHNTATFELVAADSAVSAVFNSRSGAVHPTLTVSATAVPEPGRAMLLPLGLGFLALHRRRKNALTPCRQD
jgi:MYXO-CTERM domain-containing protein